MTATPPREGAFARSGVAGIAGFVALAALAALVALQPAFLSRLRLAGHDLLQTLAPRTITSHPAVIVDIDEKSLDAHGRWPWPRSRLAELIDRIAAQGPHAIGIDILLPEADPVSAERVLGGMRQAPGAPAGNFAGLATNDAVLTRSLASAPSVLVFAGAPDPTGRTLRATPVLVQRAKGSADVAPAVLAFGGAVTSLEMLDEAAAGRGLISADQLRGVTRRVPMVASVGGTLVPSLTIEMLRVAAGVPAVRLHADGATVEGVSVDRLFIPTEADGAISVDFSRADPGRFVSAADVLAGRVDADAFASKFVIVAVTGLGIADRHTTPLGDRLPGAEIHAQVLENVYEGRYLRRPAWASAAELGAFLLLGAFVVWATPRLKPRDTAAIAGIGLATCALAAFVAFRGARVLVDVATPGLALIALFLFTLALSLAETNRQKRALEDEVERERETRARLEGEMEAARCIQVGTLPLASRLAADPRIDLAVSMAPAREVGGDFYDFFPLDAQRLAFSLGDVAGKGLPASIFMAVSKALMKSVALRSSAAELGALMGATNAEVSRDNPQMMFVTVFAAALDLDDGELVYANAGHEPPFVVGLRDGIVRRLDAARGPPLCTVDDFAYDDAVVTLPRGDWLCVVSDGVTDARDPGGTMFGAAGVARTLARSRGAASAQAIVDTLKADLDAHVAGGDIGDDATMLVLRWR